MAKANIAQTDYNAAVTPAQQAEPLSRLFKAAAAHYAHTMYVVSVSNNVLELRSFRAVTANLMHNRACMHERACMQGSLLPIGMGGGGAPVGQLAAAINSEFGNFAQFQAEFKALAVRVGLVGFIWLVRIAQCCTLQGQDAALMECLLAIWLQLSLSDLACLHRRTSRQ